MIPAVVLLASIPAALPAQDVGDPAGPLRAAQWYKWVGDGPSTESLLGQTLLVHFFVTEKPRLAGLLTLAKFHNEHADKGLVILAVTPDPPEKVEELLRDYPVPFAVGAGADIGRDWGVPGKYAQIVVDPEGEIFYRANASNAVWNGKLLKALKGAKRLKERAHLKLTPRGEYGRRAKKAIDLLRKGELAKAVAALEATLARKGPDEERADAEKLLAAVEAHVQSLTAQIEKAIEMREVLLANGALEALADDLGKHILGRPARLRLTDLEADPAHRRELEAAQQYEKLIDAFFIRGYEKNEKRFEKLREDYPGTSAAEKARQWAFNYLNRRW